MIDKCYICTPNSLVLDLLLAFQLTLLPVGTINADPKTACRLQIKSTANNIFVIRDTGLVQYVQQP